MYKIIDSDWFMCFNTNFYYESCSNYFYRRLERWVMSKKYKKCFLLECLLGKWWRYSKSFNVQVTIDQERIQKMKYVIKKRRLHQRRDCRI